MRVFIALLAFTLVPKPILAQELVDSAPVRNTEESADNAEELVPENSATLADDLFFDDEFESTYGATAEVEAPPTSASQSDLHREELAAAPARNAEELLRSAPGLTLVQHGSEGKGHQFFIRGFDAVHGADLEIRVDDVPLNEWSNIHAQGYLDLALVMPEFISEAQVTKGPFNLSRGLFSLAGTVDMRLGAPADGWFGSVELGSTSRQTITAGYGSERGFLGVRGVRDDGFGQRRGYRGATVNGRVLLIEGSNSELSLTFLGNLGQFEIPTILRNTDVDQGLVDFRDSYDDTLYGKSHRGIAFLTYESESDINRGTLQGGIEVRDLFLRENFTGRLVNEAFGDRREQFHRTYRGFLRGAFSRDLSPHVSFVSGVDVSAAQISQREQGVDDLLRPFQSRRSLSAWQQSASLLLALDITPIPELLIRIGWRGTLLSFHVEDRLDENTRRGRFFASAPTASLRYLASDHVSLFLNYGAGVRPPEARALTTFRPSNSGFSDVVNEPDVTTSHAGELGIRIESSLIDIALAGFATRLARENVFDHVSGVSVDLAGTRRLGSEAILTIKPSSWLKLRSNATFVDARFLESGQRVPFAPRFVGGFLATLRAPLLEEGAPGEGVLEAGLRLNLVAPRPLTNGARGEFMVRSGLSIAYRHTWFRVGLGIENLIGREIREGEFHYASDFLGERSVIPALHSLAAAPFNARLRFEIFLE